MNKLIEKLMNFITNDFLYLNVCIGVFIVIDYDLGIFLLLMGIYYGRSLKRKRSTHQNE